MTDATERQWSRGRLESVKECPVCAEQKRTGTPIRCRDFRGEVPDLWEMQRCGNCHSLFLDPRPDAESIPRAYDHYYTHDREDERAPSSGIGGAIWRTIHGYLNDTFGLDRQPASRLGRTMFLLMPPFRMKLDYYARHLYPREFPARGNLLDLGCGNGSFLVRARQMGWTAAGLEPDPKAVETARLDGLNVYQGMLADAPQSWTQEFDVVTMSHVIEHLPDPGQSLDAVFNFLKPGGLLWIACPNPKSLGSRFYGEAWRGLHAPFHLSIPTQSSLKTLLESVGFHAVRSIRRGVHARAIIKASAQFARQTGGQKGQIKAACAPIIQVLSDIAGTAGLPLAEETVISARRPL